MKIEIDLEEKTCIVYYDMGKDEYKLIKKPVQRLKQPKCPDCGSFVFSHEIRMEGGSHEVDFLKCTKCGREV